MNDLRLRLATIEAKVAQACATVGRERPDVTLIAVTKTVPVTKIQQAYDAGLRHFGESRWQESLPKLEHLPDDIVWHFIGTLQSNKARRIAENFDVVHTVCQDSHLRELEKADRVVDALVEINIVDEEQKAGISPGKLDAFLFRLSCCKNVRFRGLMTIGPMTSDLEQSRKVFRALKDLGQSVGAEWLSMGMSADYDVAIQEGATHVRVGSALFGDRT